MQNNFDVYYQKKKNSKKLHTSYPPPLPTSVQGLYFLAKYHHPYFTPIYFSPTHDFSVFFHISENKNSLRRQIRQNKTILLFGVWQLYINVEIIQLFSFFDFGFGLHFDYLPATRHPPPAEKSCRSLTSQLSLSPYRRNCC